MTQVVFETSSSMADERRVPAIGFVLPLSGEWAFLGNGIRDGALLAKERLAEVGTPIDFLFEDNRGELSVSAGLAKNLLGSHKVDALISIISGVAMLLRPLAADAGIIHIGICSETEAADGQHSFVNYLTAEQGVTKFIQQLGTKSRLGVFAINESGFQRIVNELKRQGADSLTLSYVDWYDRGTSDFRSILTKRKRTDVDAILLLGLSPEIEFLATQARALGISSPFVSIEGFGLAKNKAPFEGSWFVDSAVPTVEFRSQFLNRFGYEVTPGAGHVHDSVMMLSAAFEQSKDPTGVLNRPHALEAFKKLRDFTGVIGALTVRPSGVVWSEASVNKIERGQAIPLVEGPRVGQ